MLFVRGDQVLIARMCSTIVLSRETREIETEHSFNLAFCGSLLPFNFSGANVTAETVRDRDRNVLIGRDRLGVLPEEVVVPACWTHRGP